MSHRRSHRLILALLCLFAAAVVVGCGAEKAVDPETQIDRAWTPLASAGYAMERSAQRNSMRTMLLSDGALVEVEALPTPSTAKKVMERRTKEGFAHLQRIVQAGPRLYLIFGDSKAVVDSPGVRKLIDIVEAANAGQT